MYVFETPRPILATVELAAGTVRVSAGDHPRTTVQVLPGDRSALRDVATAAAAEVEYADRRLTVAVPETDAARRGAVTVDIRLPAGSGLHGDALAADFHATGRLAECRIGTVCGHLVLARTGPLHLSTLLGNVTVDRIDGDVTAVAAAGDVRIGHLDGAARFTRTRGSTRLGEITGGLRLTAESGDLHIGRAHGAVEARTGNGDLRVDEAVRGPLTLESGCGDVDVGVTGGAAAHLDLDSRGGTVYRALGLLDGAGPPPDRGTVRVRARTVLGDIVARSATANPP
ncbi:DUF4097 family beta strand repeat-containing protein [Streptomyces albus]|uniref:DUF4097 family beta strand repeat-containing protein n=1 Tax=Streptomyces albus TaxID=1888 RepID=UPI0033CF5468